MMNFRRSFEFRVNQPSTARTFTPQVEASGAPSIGEVSIHPERWSNQ
jgi:hypothetical protein